LRRLLTDISPRSTLRRRGEEGVQKKVELLPTSSRTLASTLEEEEKLGKNFSPSRAGQTTLQTYHLRVIALGPCSRGQNCGNSRLIRGGLALPPVRVCGKELGKNPDEKISRCAEGRVAGRVHSTRLDEVRLSKKVLKRQYWGS